jgi:putative ABC transport system permease protein
LKNIIPDFNNKILADSSHIKKKNIILPQKISESLGISNRLENNDKVIVQNIRDNNITPLSVKDNDTFKVISIINSTGNPIIDNSVFIETNEGKKILDKSNDFDVLFLTYNDMNKVDSIVKSIQKHFNNQVSILNSLEILKTLTKFIGGISTFISSIAVFSLIVGALGIIITIYTSVVERTHEIGILKALGSTNNTILRLFLTESIIIGIMGAIIGIIFGFFGSHFLIYTFLYFLKIPIKIYPIFNVIEILKIFTAVVGLSILSGLYPAYKGSKISPVSALNKYF